MSTPETTTASRPPDRRHGRRSRVLVAAALTVVSAWLVWILVNDGGSSQPFGSPAGDPGKPSTTPSATAPGSSAAPSAKPSAVVSKKIPVREPVRLSQTARFGDGVTAKLTSIRAIEGQAGGLGEIGGPSISVTVALSNATGDVISLGNVVVNAYFGPMATPAVPLFGDPTSRPFEGDLKRARSATATYVFLIPADERDDVTIEVSHASLSPIVVFKGSAPSD